MKLLKSILNALFCTIFGGNAFGINMDELVGGGTTKFANADAGAGAAGMGPSLGILGRLMLLLFVG